MNIAIRMSACIVATILIGAARPAASQELRRITLDEAMDRFGRNSLELRLARAELAEVYGLTRQAAAVPNPLISGTWEPLQDGDRSYSERYLNLSQRLEWPGTRGARREAGAHATKAAEARFLADSARLAFEVRSGYVRAVRAEQEERLLTRVTDVFREGERNAQRRHGEGDLSRYDLQRIRVERVRYETRLADAVLVAVAARRALTLLVEPDVEALELAPADTLGGTPPAIGADRDVQTIVGRRPELASAEASLHSARAASETARRERIPEFTATAGYKSQSDGFSGAFLGVSLPLPLWDRRSGAIEAADARVIGAESRLALAQRQVENDVRRATDTYRSLLRRADLLSGETADLLDIARVAYTEGEMELIQLLDAADAFLDARLAEIRLRTDLWTGFYDLERAVGGFGVPAREMENGR